eukprot:m.547684 g.547684  ORF g.547684 m.547684 type:complete len:368 (+) comp22157_c1_seq2:512-1615(+)
MNIETQVKEYGRDLSKSKHDRAVRLLAQQVSRPLVRKRRIIAPPMENPTQTHRHPELNLERASTRKILSTATSTDGSVNSALNYAEESNTETGAMHTLSLASKDHKLHHLQHADKPAGSKSDLTAWIHQRQAQHTQLESMGLSREWLENKTRCPAEDRMLTHFQHTPRTTGQNAERARAPVVSRRRNSSSYLARPLLHDSVSTLTKRWGDSLAAEPPAGDAISASSASKYYATAERTVPPHLRASMQRVTDFIKQNRWRLHDVFARCGYTDDYRMSVDEIASLFERVGGILPVTVAMRNSVAFENAIKCTGTLLPLTAVDLRECITWFQPDRHGLLDYRTLLDDHHGTAVLEQLYVYQICVCWCVYT